MGEQRTDWKAKWQDSQAYAAALEKELGEMRTQMSQLTFDLDARANEIEALKKKVERARAEGLRGAADFILSAE